MLTELLDCRPDLAACPAAFAETVLHLSPTDQQREFLDALSQPGSRVAVRSGHGTGKSTALAAAALWFLSTRMDALAPCTAPTAHQLHDVLWREMRRLVAGMDDQFRSRFVVTTDRVSLEGSAGMIVARTARPENPDALQGFHATEILFIIDEAAGVNDRIFEVARGALSTESARVALTGNPTRLSGYFYNAFHSSREAWQRLHFSCLESPLVSHSYAKDMAEEFGDDSDVYRVRVLGEFPRTGLFNLISLELVEDAMDKLVPEHFTDGTSRIMGVDPAWMGGDRSAGILRSGMFAKVLFHARKIDTVQLTDLTARKAVELDPDMIFVDQTGIGAGVVDQLHRTGFPVTGVAFSQRPAEPLRFVNRRAEMWWKVREWLEKGPALEKNPDLRDDLIGVEYHMADDGRVRIESKDQMRARGQGSPDLGDALALTFAQEVMPRRADPAQPERYDVYQWMRRSSYR